MRISYCDGDTTAPGRVGFRDTPVELYSLEPLCGSCRKAQLYRQAEQERLSSVEGQQGQVGEDSRVDKGDEGKDGENKDEDSKDEDGNKRGQQSNYQSTPSHSQGDVRISINHCKSL